MTIEMENLLSSILQSLDNIEGIKSDEIPDIDLYMDQVTTFMDERMKNSTRYPKTDKILTKTMINNYAKNDLLPPPVKKKYSKEHILLLIFIYYYKNILSISDIQSLLGPLMDTYFHQDKEITLSQIYDEVEGLKDVEIEALKVNIEDKFKKSQEMYPSLEGEEKEFLTQFSFICMLAYDVYIKKHIIEKMIDEMKQKALDKKEKVKEKEALEKAKAKEKEALEKTKAKEKN